MPTKTGPKDPEAVLAAVLTQVASRHGQNGAVVDRAGTRKRILDAAIEMFATHGFEACSVRDLAKAVGIKAPGLYSHFPSKEAILTEAMIRALADFLSYIGASSDSTTPQEALRDTVRRHVLFQVRHLALARSNDLLLDSEAIGRFLPAHDHALLVSAQRAYYDLVRSRIEAVLEADSSIDPSIATFAVINLCDRVTVWYKPGGRLSPDEVADTQWYFVQGMLRLT